MILSSVPAHTILGIDRELLSKSEAYLSLHMRNELWSSHEEDRLVHYHKQKLETIASESTP